MFRKLNTYLERLTTTPSLELSRWAQVLLFQIHLWRLCARRLWENNVMAMSAALSFRTIFALVPILVLGFMMLKSVGALEAGEQRLRTLLITSGFAQITTVAEPEPDALLAGPPAAQDSQVINVAAEIETLVAKVETKLTLGRVGPVGIVLLIWTATTLIGTIERSLNRIFGARRRRSLGRRIALYWSAVTLGPLILAAAIYGGEEVIAASANLPGFSRLLWALGWIGPIIVGMLFVAALYKLMPNTPVRIRAALGGAAVAVPLWLIAKWAFALYVQRVVITGNLYGALGLLPLFLLWLNFSWWIFLFGAQLAHTAANLDRIRASEESERIVLGPQDLLAAAVAVAGPYQAGQGPVPLTQVEKRLNLPRESVDWLLDRLKNDGVLCAVDDTRDPSFVLARPASKIPVLQILEIDGLPDQETTTRYTRDISRSVSHLKKQAGERLGQVSLADLLLSEESEVKSLEEVTGDS